MITVEAAIAALAADRGRGATDLAREALDILALATARSPEEGLGAYLDSVGVLVTRARPTMASVKNVVDRAMAEAPFPHPGEGEASVRPGTRVARQRGQGDDRGDRRHDSGRRHNPDVQL